MKWTTPRCCPSTSAVEVDDLAGRLGLRPTALHERSIIAVRNEADVLAVGLRRDVEPELRGNPPHLILGQVAERKAHEIELLARRAVEEIALVAARIGALVQLDPTAVDDAPDVMAGRQAIGAELARESDQVDELHALVAGRAGHRRAAVRIFVDEAVDHALAEAAFVIEHVMRDAEPVGDLLRVVNVLPGAAGAAAPHRLAMIVELQRHADHLGAGARGERGRDRAVDAARHGDDDPGIAARAAELKINLHWRSNFGGLYPNFTIRA